VHTCVHRGECSYVYEYLHLYCDSKKRNHVTFWEKICLKCKNQFFENLSIRHYSFVAWFSLFTVEVL
jgi:hypothetical protein